MNKFAEVVGLTLSLLLALSTGCPMEDTRNDAGSVLDAVNITNDATVAFDSTIGTDAASPTPSCETGLDYVGTCLDDTLFYCDEGGSTQEISCGDLGQRCGLIDCDNDANCLGYDCYVPAGGTCSFEPEDHAHCSYVEEGTGCINGVCASSTGCDEDSYVGNCDGNEFLFCFFGGVNRLDCNLDGNNTYICSDDIVDGNPVICAGLAGAPCRTQSDSKPLYCAEGLHCSDSNSGTCVADCTPNCSTGCGGYADGCGGTCPDTCIAPESCGGGGTVNTCGCSPQCEGLCAGPDGCGGTCPDNCSMPQSCGGGGIGNVCGCTPECAGRCGGADGCGGTCPDICTGTDTCGGGGIDNVCGCTPDCSGHCGNGADGCGGDCPNCEEGSVCRRDGVCVENCDLLSSAGCESTDTCQYSSYSETNSCSYGWLSEGQYCGWDDNCQSGLECYNEVCHRWCLHSSNVDVSPDCDQNEICLKRETSHGDYGLCTLRCNPQDTSWCDRGYCKIISTDLTLQAFDCYVPEELGNADVGDTCVTSLDCLDNLACVSGRCHKVCSSSSNYCSGMECVGVPGWTFYGVCELPD